MRKNRSGSKWLLLGSIKVVRSWLLETVTDKGAICQALVSSGEMWEDTCPSEVGFLTGPARGTSREILEPGQLLMVISIHYLATWKQEAQQLHHFIEACFKREAQKWPFTCTSTGKTTEWSRGKSSGVIESEENVCTLLAFNLTEPSFAHKWEVGSGVGGWMEGYCPGWKVKWFSTEVLTVKSMTKF